MNSSEDKSINIAILLRNIIKKINFHTIKLARNENFDVQMNIWRQRYEKKAILMKIKLRTGIIHLI